ATRPSFAGGAAAASPVDVPESEGFSGGWAAACLVSGFAPFGIEASGRGGGSLRRASTTLGFAGAAGAGWALAVLSAATVPLRPTLRARLLKNPSSAGALGAAEATRVAGAGALAAGEAINGSSGEVTGPCGG